MVGEPNIHDNKNNVMDGQVYEQQETDSAFYYWKWPLQREIQAEYCSLFPDPVIVVDSDQNQLFIFVVTKWPYM